MQGSIMPENGEKAYTVDVCTTHRDAVSQNKGDSENKNEKEKS